MSGKLVYSEDTYTSPPAGNVFALWKDLNIKDINNMVISFTLKVTGAINGPRGGWNSIFHITNDGKDAGAPGRRNPGIFINSNNNDPNQTFIHIALEPSGSGYLAYNTPTILKPYYETDISIIISNKILKVYFNSILVLQQNIGSSPLLTPPPDSIVYVKDPFWGEIYSYNDPNKGGIYTGKNDNFIIKNLKATDFLTSYSGQTGGFYTTYFKDFAVLESGKKLCNWGD